MSKPASTNKIEKLPAKAASKKPENNRFFARLRKKPPKNLDAMMRQLHDDEFEQIDCLDCANCCKTTGPLFTDRDIKRIAKLFHMSTGQFTDRYLFRDEDQDYVLQTLPCPFLGADNKCLIYDERPKACAEFPHTRRKNFHQIAALTKKNVGICPAAFNIVEKMKQLLR